MAKKGKGDKKKKKGGGKVAKKQSNQSTQQADGNNGMSDEELAKLLELKKLYWQEMHRQAVFLDMSHNMSRPWIESYFQVIPRLVYGIPIGPKEEGGGGKGKKGKKGKKK
ncbi:uncharacterized protein LOC120331052 [Styela clava]|uniref:uncharacterized protein LOC120331052 n=1 Tax=Styela clava TaxID=7725 RepID=UPI0019393EB5|nr:uncharacterized protein LOC120331052 [Styela clava]